MRCNVPMPRAIGARALSTEIGPCSLLLQPIAVTSPELMLQTPVTTPMGLGSVSPPYRVARVRETGLPFGSSGSKTDEQVSLNVTMPLRRAFAHSMMGSFLLTFDDDRSWRERPLRRK